MAQQMVGRDWTALELVQALALYYQIPFGAIDRKNPAIVELARELNRTPSAVSLKLANFASIDPTVIASGRRGMANASAADRRIFSERSESWTELQSALSEAVLQAIDRRRSRSTALSVVKDAVDRNAEENYEQQAFVVVRRGQQFFRNAILAAYSESCCVTEVAVRELLRASHIVPWSHDPAQRLDPRNGLCLNALHDAAFDRGLMTIDADLRVVLSRRLRDEIAHDIWRNWFGRYDGRKILLPQRMTPRAESLAYHRQNIFAN